MSGVEPHPITSVFLPGLSHYHPSSGLWPGAPSWPPWSTLASITSASNITARGILWRKKSDYVTYLLTAPISLMEINQSPDQDTHSPIGSGLSCLLSSSPPCTTPTPAYSGTCQAYSCLTTFAPAIPSTCNALPLGSHNIPSPIPFRSLLESHFRNEDSLGCHLPHGNPQPLFLFFHLPRSVLFFYITPIITWLRRSIFTYLLFVSPNTSMATPRDFCFCTATNPVRRTVQPYCWLKD